jgi:hypothetical protein
MSKRKHIPDNCEFPQLFEMVEPPKLAAKLQEHLGPAAAELRVESCKIDELNYKPGGGCRIAFTASLHHLRGGERFRQAYYGRLLQARDTQRLASLLEQKNLTPPRFGPALIHVPEWEFVLWAYPNDPRLPGLAVLAQTEKVLALAQAAPEKFGMTEPPAALAAEETKYVSGKRAGYLYHAQPRAFAGNNAAFAFYGKAYSNGRGEAAYELMQTIWRSEGCRRGDFFLPQPYSYDAENEIVWQEAFPGQSFAKIAASIPDLPEAGREIGERLAGFHNSALALPQVMTFDFQKEDVRRNLDAIAEAYPDYGEDCAVLGQKLMAAAERLGPGPITPLHASFKFSHIFATSKGLGFIDFDGANLGDPGFDVGRFIAHLYKMKADWHIEPDVADATITNFTAAYNRAAAAPLAQERIDWFAASHLIGSQIYKAVKHMDDSSVNKLWDIAERLCPA